MNDEVWLKLATRINELLAKPDVTGVVITHGTDTIEETAYFLNLVVKSRKPVVLTASMRPSTALSADGPLNFYNAVAVAASKQAHWTRRAGRRQRLDPRRVVAHEDEHDGRADLPVAALGTHRHRRVRRHRVVSRSGRQEHARSPSSRVDANTVLPRVDIIMATENMDGAMIDAAVAAGAKGIVIAGVGNGNMTKPALDALAAPAKKGIVAVRSSRVTTGQVGRNVEVNDDKLGFVASLGHNPQKSRVLLRLALLQDERVRDDPALLR